LANIVAGALVFGQFISGRSIDVSVFAAGIIITLGLHIGAYYFSKEDGSGVS
jgi:ABC-type arginine transport system permease subunit